MFSSHRARVGLAVSLSCSAAFAQGDPVCASRIERANVVACALGVSLTLREEDAARGAALGRVEAARPVLPGNPVLSGSLASRSTSTQRSTNWAVGLSQELEIAGQRGPRVEAANRELASHDAHVAAARQSVAQHAWESYFSALAAQERRGIAGRIETAALAFSTTVRAMAANGLSSTVEAEVAEALTVKAAQQRLETERASALARFELEVLTGAGRGAAVEGTLAPLNADGAVVAERPELVALRAEQEGLGHRTRWLQRSRVPNPTLSLTVQNDGFDERVFGVGLQFPVPLPQPIGRTHAGEIAETEALAVQRGVEAQRLVQQLERERSEALAAFELGRQVVALYSPERVQRAADALEAIAREVKAARLPVRDALAAQQTLSELLLGDVAAREAFALASVRVRRAVGVSLETGGAP